MARRRKHRGVPNLVSALGARREQAGPLMQGMSAPTPEDSGLLRGKGTVEEPRMRFPSLQSAIPLSPETARLGGEMPGSEPIDGRTFSSEMPQKEPEFGASLDGGSILTDGIGVDENNTIIDPESFGDNVPRHVAMARMNPAFGADFGSELIQSMIPIYTAAFAKVHGRSPNPAELEAVMAVGRHEGGFGTYKYPGGTGLGCNNHGAVQCCKPKDGVCPPGSFLASDTTPTAAGNVPYAICFKCYATPEDGAADVIKKVGKRPLELLAKTGNSLSGFAMGMYQNHYFEGFNASAATVQKNAPTFGFLEKYIGQNKIARTGANAAQMAGRVLNYAIGLDRNADAIAKGSDRPRRTTLTVKAFGFELPQVAAGAGAAVGTLMLFKFLGRKKKR